MQTTDVIFGDFSAEEEAALAPEPKEEPKPDEGQAVEAAETPEAEAPAEASTEQPEKAAEEKPQDDKPPKDHVPHGALHAEREKRKALERELAEMRQWREGVEKKLNPAQEPPKYADPIADPEGHAKWAAHQEAEGRRRDEQFAEFQRQQTARAQQDRMLQGLTQSEAAFRETTKDYDDAVAHLTQARRTEMQLFGMSAEQANEALRQEVLALVTEATQRGLNPAEIVYGIARSRGYAPTPAQPAVAGADKAAEESERLQKIAGASRSVGAASGGGGGAEITLEDIAEMSPEEIAALPENLRQRVMGG